MKRIMAFCLAFGAITAPASAQDVVARSIVDGRTVELLSDQSWRYAEARSDCDVVDDGFEFCGDRHPWTALPLRSSEFDLLYRHDSDIYIGVIQENLGANTGLKLETLRNAVLENAAGGMGVQPSDIPVLAVDRATVDGIEFEQMIFLVDLNGLEMVFVNRYAVLPDDSIQIMAWGPGTEPNDTLMAALDEFSDGFSIKAR